MKYAWIAQHRDQYTGGWLCQVLSVLRSGYCQWRVRSLTLHALASGARDAKVAVIHRGSCRGYGRPRIVQQLRSQGEHVSAQRVCRSLQRQGLRSVCRQAYVVITESTHYLRDVPNLPDRRFDG